MTDRSRDETAGDGRRRELIEATILVIAEHGISDASVEKITDRAGMSRSAIRYYFRSKGQLLGEVYRFIADEFRRTLDAVLSGRDVDPEARLRTWFEVLFRPPYMRRPILSAWIGLTHAAETDDALRAINREIYTSQRDVLIEWIAEAAQRRGVDVDARRAANGLMALMDGLWLEVTIDPEEFDPAEGERHCRDYIARLLARYP